MNEILLVSDRENWIRSFEKFLKDLFSVQITVARSSGEGRSELEGHTYSLVLILAPLREDSGIYLARQAARTSAGVIVATSPAYSPQYTEKLKEDGVFVYHTDMGRRFLADAVRLMLSLSRRLVRSAQPEAEHYRDKLKEIRTVDRAKCLLIQYQQMTEKEAHRLIEKRAMDRRVGKLKIAEEILQVYDLE